MWRGKDRARPVPARPDETQEYWLTLRAEAQLYRDGADSEGQDVAGLDALIAELDTEVARAGVRGKVTSTGSSDGKPPARRSRSTRRRQDAAKLPRHKVDARTIGTVYTAPDGKRYRPSMFLTLICDSLGAAGIRLEIANGQFTIIGRTVLNGQQAVELKINVPPSNEAPPHTTAARLWVNAKSYLPMREYTRMSNGQQNVTDYVFLPPTPGNLAKLRPVIPAGYTRAGCA